jgi:hypothetical protein
MIQNRSMNASSTLPLPLSLPGTTTCCQTRFPHLQYFLLPRTTASMRCHTLHVRENVMHTSHSFESAHLCKHAVPVPSFDTW